MWYKTYEAERWETDVVPSPFCLHLTNLDVDQMTCGHSWPVVIWAMGHHVKTPYIYLTETGLPCTWIADFYVQKNKYINKLDNTQKCNVMYRNFFFGFVKHSFGCSLSHEPSLHCFRQSKPPQGNTTPQWHICMLNRIRIRVRFEPR